jgi:hypothetical protein
LRLACLGLLNGNPLLVFIALFVYLAAASEAHAAQMRQVSRGMIVSDAMITKFESQVRSQHLAPSSNSAVKHRACRLRTEELLAQHLPLDRNRLQEPGEPSHGPMHHTRSIMSGASRAHVETCRVNVLGALS